MQRSGVSGSRELEVVMYIGDSDVAFTTLSVIGVTASASSVGLLSMLSMLSVAFAWSF